MNFKELNLVAPLLQALENEGYTSPTPIQAQAIPIVLAGRDLIGCAQTGTGKTAAFALPILQLLHQKPTQANHIQCLILTPTRELAIQIGESFESYGRHLDLRTTVIYGGVSQVSQVSALKRGVDILIATPGRLLDLLQQKFVHLHKINLFVLDEADRMLDMGFIHDVKRVIALLPTHKQTMLFSATMPTEIKKLADSLLHNPEKVEVTPVSSTVEIIEQSFYRVGKKDKRHLLEHLLKQANIKSVIVFTRTKHGANKLVTGLTHAGISAEAIHGNKSQTARQRALSNFKSGETRVLVATDIAARGIDIDDLTHVINYELPEVPETYVHRIGRTGRAGASGTAISFCDAEELDYLKGIQKLIGKNIHMVADHPYVDTEKASIPAPSQQTKRPTTTPERRNFMGNKKRDYSFQKNRNS